MQQRAEMRANQVEGGKVADPTRIARVLPTIAKLAREGAKVIVLSHLGRPKGTISPETSLKPVAEKMKELMGGTPVRFVGDCIGEEARNGLASLRPGEVAVLQNVRFYPGEEKNDIGPWGGPYMYGRGTSQAAPFVSNVAAKLFSLCPSLGATEAKRLILETTDAAPDLAGKVATGGVINSLRAYRCAAVIAKVEKGGDLGAAIGALPGGVSPGERERLERLVRDVLAARKG